MSDEYEAFLARKVRTVQASGFEPGDMPDWLFDFQKDLVRWAIRRGRAALFASTGLGKTRQELQWCDAVAKHTGGDVLLLAPLAVAAQTVREAERVGVQATLCRDGADVRPGINVTNYDRLHRFDTERFVGVAMDESSAIKAYTSKLLAQLIERFSQTPYRLSASATPAPNDYTELGTQAEFLGVCSRVEMLSEWFVHDGGETQTWRLKGHARADFWRWVASWAALVRRPEDLGYDGASYVLPPLRMHEHILPVDHTVAREVGLLFAAEASTLTERRAARKASIGSRVEAAAKIVNADASEQWLVWCEYNAEADALTALIKDSVEIRGPDDPDVKEERLLAFADGRIRVLVSKPVIAGHGLNFQRCARMAFVGVSDSWEQRYQAIRRCWRFGQTRAVDVHVFASEIESDVIRNLARKEADAERMAEELSAETRESVIANIRGSARMVNDYRPKSCRYPSWLGTKEVA